MPSRSVVLTQFLEGRNKIFAGTADIFCYKELLRGALDLKFLSSDLGSVTFIPVPLVTILPAHVSSLLYLLSLGLGFATSGEFCRIFKGFLSYNCSVGKGKPSSAWCLDGASSSRWIRRCHGQGSDG